MVDEEEEDESWSTRAPSCCSSRVRSASGCGEPGGDVDDGDEYDDGDEDQEGAETGLVEGEVVDLVVETEEMVQKVAVKEDRVAMVVVEMEEMVEMVIKDDGDFSEK